MRALLRVLCVCCVGVPAVTPAAGSDAREGTVEVNGVSLPYEIAGAGRPLVLIHGWAVNRAFWDDDVERLARHYTVIRYDRRGFGGAGGKPDLTADPADLKMLLERLGHTEVHVMGHSQGADVALTFAVRYPKMVRGLVLFGPGPPDGLGLPVGGDTQPVTRWIEAGSKHGIDSLRAAIANWAGDQFGETSPDVMRRGRKLLESYDGADLLDPAPPSNLVKPARVDDLRAVTAPTLIVHGEREIPFVRISADVLAYGIRGARKVVIPEGGHTINWTDPDRFAEVILRFLREADEAPRTER